MTGREQATCCVMVLLFCFFSTGASSYNGQTCSGDKPVANSTYCTKTAEPVNASECQAAESYPLRLVCSACSDGITWQRWNGFKWETIAGTHNQQILEYTAEEVVPSLAGCYRCWCYASVVFSVDVQAPEPPKLLIPNTPEEHREFILYPVTVNLVLNQQMVCFPFTSTGWPDVAYDMYYRPNPEEDDYLPVTAKQTCLELCYIPPVGNRIGDFMSVIHNIVGNITALQPVLYNADPIWSIKPHSAQTSGNVIMDHEGGVGKAVCAAYKEDPDVTLQYFVCPIPNGMTAEEAACLYYLGNLSCNMCGDGGAGFNSTRSDSVSDLGIETRSCLVDVWVEGQFVCLAQRQWMNGSKSIYQPIGNFTTSKPVPHPSIISGLIAGNAILALVLAVCCIGCCCEWWCWCGKHKNGPLATQETSKESGLAEVLAEKEPLIQRTNTKSYWNCLLSLPPSNPKPTATVTLRCKAPVDPDFTELPTASLSSSNPFHLELGKEYQIRVNGIVLNFSTPEDSRKELKQFPSELEKAVPLDTASILQYCDKLAPHYEEVGHLLGLGDSARCLRSGNDSLRTKMMHILDEWILSGEATWAILVLGLEKRIQCLRGVASEIRKDLREGLEKSSLVPPTASGTNDIRRSPPPVSEETSTGFPVTAEITPQPGVGEPLHSRERTSMPHDHAIAEVTPHMNGEVSGP